MSKVQRASDPFEREGVRLVTVFRFRFRCFADECRVPDGTPLYKTPESKYKKCEIHVCDVEKVLQRQMERELMFVFTS